MWFKRAAVQAILYKVSDKIDSIFIIKDRYPETIESIPAHIAACTKDHGRNNFFIQFI